MASSTPAEARKAARLAVERMEEARMKAAERDATACVHPERDVGVEQNLFLWYSPIERTATPIYQMTFVQKNEP